MKAQVINSFGKSSVFTMVDMPIPEIKAGHLLIKVHATSVNPIDCKVRSGDVSAIAPLFPAILHGDVAGTVEAVGDGVADHRNPRKVQRHTITSANVVGLHELDSEVRSRAHAPGHEQRIECAHF